jgi:hypothetical protein
VKGKYEVKVSDLHPRVHLARFCCVDAGITTHKLVA